MAERTKGSTIPRPASRPASRTEAGPAARQASLIETRPDGDGRRLALLAAVSLLCVLGLMMVLSASSVDAVRSKGDVWAVFVRQVLWVALGLTALLVASSMDYHAWRRMVRPMLVVSFLLLVVVLVPGVGISANGSTRWLGSGSWRFQPSELAKLALLVFTADLLARRRDRIDDVRASLRPVLLVTGLFVLPVMLQPDMGTTIVFVAVVLALLFAGGIPLRPLVTLGLTTIAVSLAAGFGSGYRRQRLLSFLDPFADAGNTGYQVAQSLVALGSGHVTGVGLGASRAKWGFLPNAHTDFIFAIIGEELGLFGTLAVVALFAVIAGLGVATALRARDRFGALLATGITTWIVGQALINMGAVTGLLPVTGVPLPFVSFGGSAMVVTMGAIGILRSIAIPRPAGDASAAAPSSSRASRPAGPSGSRHHRSGRPSTSPSRGSSR